MLIFEFARKTGLTTDTVRFQVRRRLPTPETNGKGGRNPYQVFTARPRGKVRLHGAIPRPVVEGPSRYRIKR
jgi:hypothetical protein